MQQAPRFVQTSLPDADAQRAEAAAGLLARPARVAPKFFYDELGSQLFAAITRLPEYYLTRTEAALIAAQREPIAAAVRAALGTGITLVEPGAGNGEKAAALFDVLQVRRYVALDISVAFLRRALADLQARHPAVEMTGVGLDLGGALRLPPDVAIGPALVFYPGSSIGNFDPDEALALLRRLRTLADGGALLIGIDLDKSAALLQPAYDDALGVTAAFNLNLLLHLNRLLGSNFDVRAWRHVALVNAAAARVEMHLEARQALTVAWPGAERPFAAGERIHTENTYKWRRRDFEALLHDAGFGAVQGWTDERGWFALLLARPG